MDPLRALALSVLEPTEPEPSLRRVCPGCGVEVDTVPVGNGFRRLYAIHDRGTGPRARLCPAAGMGFGVLAPTPVWGLGWGP